jgi:putative Holliday junction resolvase
MKLIGLDYGRRRIGIAITDAEGISIRGLATLDCKKHPDAVSTIAEIIKREAPDRIIVGLPLDSFERETAMSREIREFARRIEEETHCPLSFIEESFSSAQAKTILLTRKKKTRRRKDEVDRIAACLILEAFLKEHQCAAED